MIKATATADAVLKGGAMFDACGSVVGFNMVVDKGTQLAFIIDPLGAGFDKVGIKARVADAACSGAAQQSGGEADSRAEVVEAAADSRAAEDQQPPDDSGYHLPHGTEWLGLGIIVVLALLATRKITRDQVARVLTQRRPAYNPPAPYPMAPIAYQAPPHRRGPRSPRPLPFPTKPVVRGLTGQYAGASIPVDAQPDRDGPRSGRRESGVRRGFRRGVETALLPSLGSGALDVRAGGSRLDQRHLSRHRRPRMAGAASRSAAGRPLLRRRYAQSV